MSKAVVILSGGMDSITLLHYVIREFGYGGRLHAISFQYGQRHSKELEFAKINASNLKIPHKIIDISFLQDITKDVSALTGDIKVPHIKEVLGDPQPVTYVPFRNMLFLTVAFAYAENVGANVVFYGAQKHDTYSGYWDASREFKERYNHIVSLNRRHQIELRAPFVDMSKSDLLKWGLSNNIHYEDTWTCYNGEEHPCGTCPTCSDRIQAFMSIGVEDPLIYKEPDPWGRKITIKKYPHTPKCPACGYSLQKAYMGGCPHCGSNIC